ncbi:voltage-gated purine nucleotide uniporter SLC17A9-like [Saccoglossus kowalevskii]
MFSLLAFHYPAMASVVARKVHIRNRSFLYTAVGAGTNAGNLMSGSLGSVLVEYVGWRSMFYFFGAISVVWALATRILLLRMKCFHPCIVQKIHADEATNVSKKAAWKILLKHKAFWALIATMFCSGYAWHTLFSWLPTYFGDTFPDEKGWVFNVVPWIFNIPSHFCSGYIADWLIANHCTRTVARKYLQTIGTLFNVTCLFLIGHINCYVQALGLLCFTLFTDGLGSAGAYTNVQDLAPTHGGAIYGVMNTLSSLPGFIGVYISGHILEAFNNSWTAVFSLAASINFSGYIVFMIWGSGDRIV